MTQGTGAMDRDNEGSGLNLNEYDFRSSNKNMKSVGRQTQFSMSPWTRTVKQQSQSKTRMKDAAM